jgi:hypothetical protein
MRFHDLMFQDKTAFHLAFPSLLYVGGKLPELRGARAKKQQNVKGN